MANDEQNNPQPAQPPEINRKITFYPVQLIVMCLIGALPVLALLGVFGERDATVSGQNTAFHLEVEYPRLFRYKTDESLRIMVQNRTEQTQEDVTVRVSTDYIAHFSNVVFTPDTDQITPEAYEVELGALEAGEARIITVDLVGKDAGQHAGTVSVRAAAGDVLPVAVTTLVFP